MRAQHPEGNRVRRAALRDRQGRRDATLRGLFAALEGGQCEFLCEYQDEIDGVYHGLFEKRI